MMIRTKSVYSPIDRETDGLRLLVTRFRGRGMPTTRYDVWMPNLGPSESLLKAGQAKKIEWREFSRRYLRELLEGGTIDARNKTVKNRGQKFTLRLLQRLGKRGHVTLLCHCDEDERECHRHLLKKKLAAKPGRKAGRPVLKSVLPLTLTREPFDDIASGKKKTEYRERKKYWKVRLEGKTFDIVRFRNGYSADSREMDVEYLGLRKVKRKGENCYAIRLGRILKTKRLKKNGAKR